MKKMYLWWLFNLGNLSEIQKIATAKEIEIVAIENIAIEDLTDEDYITISRQSDGEIIFRLHAESYEKAEEAIISIIDELYSDDV